DRLLRNGFLDRGLLGHGLLRRCLLGNSLGLRGGGSVVHGLGRRSGGLRLGGLRRGLLDRGLLALLLRLLLSHGLRAPSPFPLVADGENTCDLALRRPDPGAVLERAGGGLEAEVEELLATLAERPLQLVVGHLAERSSFQRDQPLSSRSWS